MGQGCFKVKCRPYLTYRTFNSQVSLCVTMKIISLVDTEAQSPPRPEASLLSESLKPPAVSEFISIRPHDQSKSSVNL